MSFSPVERILGVPTSSDAGTLLGLGPGRHDRVTIEAALRDRLDETYAHPDGRTPDAEIARRALRLAASRLTETALHAPRADLRPLARRVQRGVRRATAPPKLTEFDRSVLATLVGCGGWNARSRARLVALASSYGVSADGLFRVIHGLSEYAAAGGHHLEMEDIAQGAPSMTLPPLAADPGAVEGRLGERLLPEPVEDSPWPTIKLSILFGLITVLAFALLLRLIWPIPIETAPPGDEPVAAEPASPGLALTSGPEPVSGSATDAARLAIFSAPPTFLGNALPTIATDAADRCPELPQQLDEVARKLTIADEPSEAVYRTWIDAIAAIAAGWVLVDESTRTEIDLAVGEALHEGGDAPSTSDRLIESLRPPRPPLADPIDVWRGAWQAGTLGRVAGSRVLPPSVVERARIVLAEAIDDEVGGGFAPAADAWLRAVTVDLAERTERDARAEDFWEVWLAAERELDEPALRGHDRAARERMNVAIMTAVRHLLATSTDLSRPGPSVDVLGRLLTIADFETSVVVRDGVRQLFDDPEVGTHDLWVLTSLLARLDTAPWFDETLVLPHDAGTPYRNRLRDRIVARWPAGSGAAEVQAARGRGVMVDSRAGARWLELLDRLEAVPVPENDTALMEWLVLGSRLNEAAGQLAARDVAAADAVLDALEAALAEDATGARPRPRSWINSQRRGGRRGQAVGNDGEWSAAYLDLARNTEEKLHALRGLRNRPGTDLGPLDAEVFVREAYRGSPREVRSLARAVVVEQFSRGPYAAMEMLDQFPDAPRDERMSETIRMLTGRLLPPARSESWPAQARLALVEHALSLRPAGRTEVDELADTLRESLVTRALLVQRDPETGVAVLSPEAAAQFLADAWQDRAQTTIARWAVPDDLDGLARRRETRRRLVRGAIQSMVAAQLAVLDNMAYVTVAEQPALRDRVLGALADGAEQRRRRGHVLGQAIEIERSAARLWAMRMTLAGSDGKEAVR
ncbi:MAG: hypothetical protein GY715_17535 [Planctomycetes bacterium]|nr:hypothetical protein [Planctomycetota bacterium]